MPSFFLHPGIAGLAAALAAIPIIIHLINRRKFRRIDWAAMEFLLEALRKNRRRVRIEQLILLALRIALMVLLAFLLARPVLSGRGLEWLSGAFRSEDRIFVLDDSLSTRRREADRSTFDRLKEALLGQVRRMAERGSKDHLTIVRASRHKTPLARGMLVDRDLSLRLAQTIGSLGATDTRLRLADCLEGIAESAARDETSTRRPRSISILTDLRAIDWTNGRGGPEDRVAQALQRLGGAEETPTRIFVLDAGTDDVENVAISRLELESGRPIAEIPTELRVEVSNFGITPVRGLGLRLRYAPAPAASLDERTATVIGPALPEVPPGETIAATIACTFRAPGWYGVTVEITGGRDGLPADDESSLALEVAAGTEVLLVSGEPSSEPFEGETDFLAEALSPAGEVASGLRPRIVLEESIPGNELARFPVIFLANVHGVPPETVGLLARQVEDGATLVLFPGDQSDAPLLNRQLGLEGPEGAGASPGRGLLPARVGEVVAPEEPVGLLPEFDQPYFRLLREAKDLTGMVRVARRYALAPVPGAQVLVRFSDADRSPALVERAVGRGRVLLFALPADLEWHDWPRNPSFLMMLQEIVNVAARSRLDVTPSLAGEPVRVPLDIATHALQAALRTPGYPTAGESVLSAAPVTAPGGSPSQQGHFQLELRDTERAGLYALGLKSKSGEVEWRELAVRRDPAESDLRRITAARLRELYPEADITVVKDASAFADVGRGAFEISDALLWIFITFLFLEVFLARVFAHHPAAGPNQAGGA